MDEEFMLNGNMGITPIRKVTELEHGTTIKLGGIASRIWRTTTKYKKQTMAILELKDRGGRIEVLVFPEVYKKYCSNVEIEKGTGILVCGEISKKEEEPKIVAYKMYPLDKASKLIVPVVPRDVP